VNKLDQVLAQARITASPCSLIFLDLDHFKRTNDRYGHLIGDEALRCFARVMTETVRVEDTVGRWGGEEFLVILPRTGTQEARSLAEQVRTQVQQRVAIERKLPHLTCSLGVATAPDDASEREELIKQADRALYTAKRLGRNQVRTAGDRLVRTSLEPVPAHGCPYATRTEEIVEALLALIEARDPSLSWHARRVSLLCRRLAQELRLNQEEIRLIALSGLLHDLGRIALPDEFLCCSYRDICGKEEPVRAPLIAAEILAPLAVLHPLLPFVRSHNEWINGSGSPDGLKGEKIPLGARIVAVASLYETSLVDRPPLTILQELRAASASRLDQRVVEALGRVLALSPHRSNVGVE
jgi:diguanylate cyclase (GGDEF)-like protein